MSCKESNLCARLGKHPGVVNTALLACRMRRMPRILRRHAKMNNKLVLGLQGAGVLVAGVVVGVVMVVPGGKYGDFLAGA